MKYYVATVNGEVLALYTSIKNAISEIVYNEYIQVMDNDQKTFTIVRIDEDTVIIKRSDRTFKITSTYVIN